MEYYFSFGFAKDHKWLDGTHKEEKYENGKQAFARYIEIQRNGKKAEEELTKNGMLPDGNHFLCTVDIYHNGEYNLAASFAFFNDAFDVLNGEVQQLQSNQLNKQNEEDTILQRE